MNIRISGNQLIILAIVAGIVLLLGSCIAIKNNQAIHLEETVYNVTKDVTIQEKRRHDLILSLVEAVKDYRTYESSTQIAVTEMRVAAQQGDLDKVMELISVVVENYPDLKSVDTYKNLMTELSITENLIAEHRKTVNSLTKDYRAFTRKFPNNILLSVSGYNIIDFSYLEFSTEETQMPESLFGE